MSWFDSFPLSSRPLLVATDFDGTLAPIVEEPMRARALPESVAHLHRLARLPGVELAVVSGRSLEAMEILCQGFPRHWKAGEHGHALCDPDGIELKGPQEDLSRLEEVAFLGKEVAARFPGVGFERKRRSVALHTRQLEGEREAGLEAISDWCRHAVLAGLLLVPGREVMEMTLPGGGKLQAVESVRDAVGARCVAYAGDDLTDMDALRSLGLRRDGLAIWVASPERETPAFPLDLVVEGPQGWCDFLGELARILEEMR